MTKSKKNYLIIFGIIALIIGQAVIRIVYSELHPSKEKLNKSRVYNGEYKGRLEEKYPSYFKDIEIAREEINKSIKSHRAYRNQEKTNYIITDYFDEKGRLVFSSEEYDEAGKRAETIGKSKDFYYKKYTPSEKGFIYDKDGKVVKKIVANGGMSYKAKTKDSKITFLKNYYTGVSVIKVKYLEDGAREEEKESMGVITQNYEKIICKYKKDILLSEKILFDSESDEGFIIATVEKKFNEKGELIYKTVERKDKTNDYKSFTEMDFVKDEIATKYYKGKDVFATVTENLVGPVEAIEETWVERGEEVKKVYKNKVKVIVKRQRVGEPVKIVDVIEYIPKDIREKNKPYDLKNRRCIYENNKIKYVIDTYRTSFSAYSYHSHIYNRLSMENAYLYESFYDINNEAVAYSDLSIMETLYLINENEIQAFLLKEDIREKIYEDISLGLIENIDKKYLESSNKKLNLLELENIK